MKLFPRMELAVRAMALCCSDDEREEHNKTQSADCDKSPIARSEVFNETWMLRLTLALIHDYDGSGFENSPSLKLIQNAVQQRWISEGGLEPAFDKEGTTWTDAILGNVKLDDSTEPKAKRGVIVDVDEKCGNSVGIVVIEAKMNSALASCITHASDYNQAARNIACLAKLTMTHVELQKKSAFIVFAPRKKIEDWHNAGRDPNEMIKGAWTTIKDQMAERDKQGEKGKNHARYLNVDNEESMETAVNSIIETSKSKAMPWEEVIECMADDKTGAYEFLKRFYKQTCDEYGIEPKWK